MSPDQDRPTLALLTQVVFNERDYQRFGLEEFTKQGFQVQIWDFSGVLLREMNSLHRPHDEIKDMPGLRRFESVSDFAGFLVTFDAKKVYAICNLDYSLPGVELRFALRRAGILYADCSFNKIPAEYSYVRNSEPAGASEKPKPKIPWYKLPVHWLRLFRLYLRCNWDIRENWNARRFASFQKTLGPPDFTIAGGTQGRLDAPAGSAIIAAHTMDYDRYLLSPAGVATEHIVFLDEYLPFHPDFLFLGIKTAEPEEYFGELNHIFALLEQKYGLPVVIAAHPRADLEVLNKWYTRRKVVSGMTQTLIARAALVCGHASTSFNFCVLYEKPALLISLDCMAKYNRIQVDRLASHLEVPVVRHSSQDDQWSMLAATAVNQERYDEYRNRYIKEDGTPEKPLFRIVAEAFHEHTALTGQRTGTGRMSG